MRIILDEVDVRLGILMRGCRGGGGHFTPLLRNRNCACIGGLIERASDSGRYSGVVMDYAAPFFAIGFWIENLTA